MPLESDAILARDIRKAQTKRCAHQYQETTQRLSETTHRLQTNYTKEIIALLRKF